MDISGKNEIWPNLWEKTRRILTVIVIGNMMPKNAKIILDIFQTFVPQTWFARQ